MVNRLKVERGTIVHFAKWTAALAAGIALVWLALTALGQA
jgi:hypothetical protein